MSRGDDDREDGDDQAPERVDDDGDPPAVEAVDKHPGLDPDEEPGDSLPEDSQCNDPGSGRR